MGKKTCITKHLQNHSNMMKDQQPQIF